MHAAGKDDVLYTVRDTINALYQLMHYSLM